MSGSDLTINTIPSEGMPVPSAGEATADTASETTKNIESAAPEKAESKAEVSQPESKGEDTRFDKHPRWQEMLKARDEARADAQKHMGQVEAMQKQIAEMQKQQQDFLAATREAGKERKTSRDYDAELRALNSKLESGDLELGQALAQRDQILREQMEERIALVEQSARQTAEQTLREERQQQEVKSIQDRFLTENKDFAELRDTGAFKKFLDADPMHDVFSAYYALKAEMAEKAKEDAVRDAVEKAIRETEEKFKVKRHAATLGSGPASTAGMKSGDEDLQDTAKSGGLASALAARLVRMRQAAA